MLRFTQMNFNVRPEKNGNYIVFRKHTKQFENVTFTTEYGWNTEIYDDGEISNKYAISDEIMASTHNYWLKPYTISSNYWFDEIETMLDEVRAELKGSAEDYWSMTEDEKYRCDNLEELRDLLEKAKDFAEVLR